MHFRHRRRAGWVSSAEYAATWAALTRDSSSSGSSSVGTPTPEQAPGDAPRHDVAVLPSLEDVVQDNLTAYWATFRPDDLGEDPDPGPLAATQLLDELRLRTAPWGTDDWEAPTPPPSAPPSETSDTASTADQDDHSDSSSLISLEDGVDFSGAPLRLRLHEPPRDLLDPPAFRVSDTYVPPNPSVDLIPPLRVTGPQRAFVWKVTRDGVSLPRPAGAPHVFRETRATAVMDRVITAWEDAGLLAECPALKNAFQMFLVPKPDGTARPIIDFSPWTGFIRTPKFSLLPAGAALRTIPPSAYLVKLDLTSGFHQLAITPETRKFNGIYYRGRKLCLMRLPMGHALAPSVFQRLSEGVLHLVESTISIKGVPYLDDWLFWADDAEDVVRVVEFVASLGITINFAKSIIQPCQRLVYLGFIVDTRQHTLKLTLEAHARMMDLLKFIRNGSFHDRQRIHGYLAWIFYNLRFPLFLARDALVGDPTWIGPALRDLRVLRPQPILPPPAIVDVFTDATPHSVAAVIPSLGLSTARAFPYAEEINVTETCAALLGLSWASEELQDVTLRLYTDNAAVLHTLRAGKGAVYRHQLVRRLFLSTLHNLGSNDFTVERVASLQNPADRPSREVLNLLLAAPARAAAGLLGAPDASGFTGPAPPAYGPFFV